MRVLLLCLFAVLVTVFAQAPPPLTFQSGDKTYAGLLHNPSVTNAIPALNTSIAGSQEAGASICRLRGTSLTCFIEMIQGSAVVGSIALVQQNKEDANDKGTVLHLFSLSQTESTRFPLEETINVSTANGDALGAGNMYVNAYAGSAPSSGQNVTVADLGQLTFTSKLDRADYVGTASLEATAQAVSTLYGATFFATLMANDNLIEYYLINSVNGGAGCNPGGWHLTVKVAGLTDQGGAQTGEAANTWGLSANMDCLPQIQYGVAPAPPLLQALIAAGTRNLDGNVALEVFSIPNTFDTSRPINNMTLPIWRV